MFIIKQLRRKKNINQTQLADAIGVSLRTIQLYEKKNANIPIKNLTKIAQYFDLSIAELYAHEVNDAEEVYMDKLSALRSGIKFLGTGKYAITVPLVPGEVHEDYVEKRDDADFMDSLSKVSFVLEYVEDSKYAAFEITNNSMDDGTIGGIPNKAIVLGKRASKEEMIQRLEHDQPFTAIIVYGKGIMCKNVVSYNETSNTITCTSLNESPEYGDFQLPFEDIIQLFSVVKKQIS